jgi:hypothetical protein
MAKHGEDAYARAHGELTEALKREKGGGADCRGSGQFEYGSCALAWSSCSAGWADARSGRAEPAQESPDGPRRDCAINSSGS